MRKKILHIVVIIGALSNAAILAFMDMPVWLIILMSVIYIIMFEGLLLILEPRLVRAERERNVKAFPFYGNWSMPKKRRLLYGMVRCYIMRRLKAMPTRKMQKRFYFMYIK